MEEEREYDEGRKLVVESLIDKATDSTKPEIEPRLLKAIKSVVRNSEPELRLAAKTLINLMKQDHSQVRYLTLLIIDELFMRSKHFRTLLVENLDLLLTLSIGFKKNLPLPKPPAVASALRSKAIEFLEKWNASFGIHYRQLRLGFDYLKNTLRFQFPNLQANAARVQQERREREARTKEILLSKFETLKSNYSSIKDEIQSTIDEIGECLDIIKAKDDNLPLAPLDDEEMEEFRNSELRQIRLDSLKEGEKVHEDSDNKVVFDALRELYKLLLTKHMVSIQDWISVLIRVEVSDNRVRDSILKEFIDIRNLIKSLKSKCEETGCALVNPTNQNEEDIWEEGIIASLDTDQDKVSGPLIEQITKGSVNEAQESSKNRREKRTKGSKVIRKMDIESKNPLKSKLLTEAPVMQWGSFLDNWGSNRDHMANQRGLEFDGHWGRVDPDAVIPAEKIAELNVQATFYKEEPFEIPECRAPLKKGKFCERRDLKICPFHGPIIPRDDRGKPIMKDEGSTDEIGPDLAEKLAKEAVKNVRERDKEDVKKREYEKKVSKRAKLAKVREHNDAVLRDAAMASTSRTSGIFEDEFETVDGVTRSSVKNKKETLASMLKKKVSAKDRLAERLLNTRAKDATTRQLTLGEDSKYRESFPNQW